MFTITFYSVDSMVVVGTTVVLAVYARICVVWVMVSIRCGKRAVEQKTE